MNEKFVATNQFIFLEHFIFKSPSTQQIPVIIIVDTIFHSHQRWMDKQTYRKADRVNPWTIYQ